MKEYNTLSELQGSTQAVTGLMLYCRENLYYYIVQASGYTATGDDVTFANGRVGKAVDIADAKYVKTTGGNVQDDINSIIAGGLPSQSGNEFKFLTTNGTSASWIKGTIQYEGVANMQAASPTVTGTTCICQERANARYILAASGYTALPGDITAANGRVWVLQKLGGVWNARHFGAKGDDSNDDASALNDALSRLSQYESLHIPAGTYRVSSSLILDTWRTSVFGDGNSTRIKRSDDTFDIFDVGPSDPLTGFVSQITLGYMELSGEGISENTGGS